MSLSQETSAIILAAGQGTRMKSSLPKVLHPVAGHPMLWYPVSAAHQVTSNPVAIVVGHGAEQVRAYIEGEKTSFDPYVIVEQTEQLGTGHAVQQAYPRVSEGLEPSPKQYLIMNGDTPLLQKDTLGALLDYHHSEKAVLTLLTTVVDEPQGYGRVVRDNNGAVARVVEERDASESQRNIREINVGTYVVEATFLKRALGQLRPQNAQGEFYLTDIIEIAVREGARVMAWSTSDNMETTGINTRVHLSLVEKEMRRRNGHRLMLEGVTIVDPDRVYIDEGVNVGQDTVLYPGVRLEGRTQIGKNCTIGANSTLKDSSIGDNVRIQDSCILTETQVHEDAVLGPFTHLRPGSVIHRKAKIGNYVELKNTQVGEGSKINHLSYLGDTSVGRNVNIGAGTITCNYDGYRKEHTYIEDDVFIGSDVQLIAPLVIGAGALIAAGTTVTEDVPSNALGISRVPQTNKEGTAARRRALLDPQESPGIPPKSEA